MMGGKDIIDKSRNKSNNLKLRTICIWILDSMLIPRKNLKTKIAIINKCFWCTNNTCLIYICRYMCSFVNRDELNHECKCLDSMFF